MASQYLFTISSSTTIRRDFTPSTGTWVTDATLNSGSTYALDTVFEKRLAGDPQYASATHFTDIGGENVFSAYWYYPTTAGADPALRLNSQTNIKYFGVDLINALPKRFSIMRASSVDIQPASWTDSKGSVNAGDPVTWSQPFYIQKIGRGVGPFSYNWSIDTSGYTNTITVNTTHLSPTNLYNTTFSRVQVFGTNGMYEADGYVRCTVTDNGTMMQNSDGTPNGILRNVTAAVPFHISVSITGGTPGGGGGCVWENSVMHNGKLAKDLKPGDELLIVSGDGETFEKGKVKAISFSPQPCYRLVSESGASVICSDSTPLQLRDGSLVSPKEILGKQLPVLAYGKYSWENIVDVSYIGRHTVAKIDAGNKVYAAGLSKNKQIFTHNSENKD